MKKLILSLVVAAFAVAVQAGDDASCSAKADGACCAAKQASMQKQAECPMAAKQAKANAKNSKSTKQVVNKQQLKSPKAVS